MHVILVDLCVSVQEADERGGKGQVDSLINHETDSAVSQQMLGQVMA